MSKIMIIGAGGVGRVVAYKCAQNTAVFSEIWHVSRTQSKCDAIAADIQSDLGVTVHTDQVDADIVLDIVELFERIRPDMVIHVALLLYEYYLSSVKFQLAILLLAGGFPVFIWIEINLLPWTM